VITARYEVATGLLLRLLPYRELAITQLTNKWTPFVQHTSAGHTVSDLTCLYYAIWRNARSRSNPTNVLQQNWLFKQDITMSSLSAHLTCSCYTLTLEATWRAAQTKFSGSTTGPNGNSVSLWRFVVSAGTQRRFGAAYCFHLQDKRVQNQSSQKTGKEEHISGTRRVITWRASFFTAVSERSHVTRRLRWRAGNRHQGPKSNLGPPIIRAVELAMATRGYFLQEEWIFCRPVITQLCNTCTQIW
jgi:hypothetical protein